MLAFYIVNWLDYSEDRLFGMGRKVVNSKCV